MKISNKDFVKRTYPKARAERHKGKGIGGEVYWLIRDSNCTMYLAEGKTESNAWQAAKEKIEHQSVKEMEN